MERCQAVLTRADVDAKVGKASLEEIGYLPQAAGRHIHQEKSITLLRRKYSKEIRLGHQQLALKKTIRKRSGQTQAYRTPDCSWENEILTELKMKNVGHGIGIGDDGNRAVAGWPVEEQPRISVLRRRLRQRALKAEAALPDEVRCGRQNPGVAWLIQI